MVSELGAGAMGSVWRAHDLKLKADVAIKLLQPELAQSALAAARFRREAEAAAAIRSTYVVQIFDHGVDEGTPFIAMELLNGESLATRLKRVKLLSPSATSRLMSQIARALSLAHEHGIIHRDLKPDNVFLVREGDEDIGKLLDFGIARRVGSLDTSVALTTRPEALLGTPYYMSPEQANGQATDALTDVWSFGIIACECLTGQRPFVAQTLGALFHQICHAPMPLPSALGAVPPGFDEWFARTAARDTSERCPSIARAAEELRALCEVPAQALSGSAPTWVSARPHQRPAGWLWLGKLAVAAALVIGALVYLGQRLASHASSPRASESLARPRGVTSQSAESSLPAASEVAPVVAPVFVAPLPAASAPTAPAASTQPRSEHERAAQVTAASASRALPHSGALGKSLSIASAGLPKKTTTHERAKPSAAGF